MRRTRIVQGPDSSLCVSNCLNSQLYSSGDLSIIGQGSIHSMIHADGELLVKGIVRGGELYARKGMSIQEVGSESGTKTKLIVPPDQSIRVEKAMEGTTLQIGQVPYVLLRTMSHIHARLDDEGKVRL